MTESGQTAIVTVTGANGFLGSHIVKLLLETTAYKVRATVREPSNAAKIAFLQDLPNASERLQIVAGDLETQGSFDQAFEGATYVIHTAAKVALTAPDPQKDIIDVNINGVKNVLESCQRAKRQGSLKCLVMTSSTAAIQDQEKPEGYVFTENDYNLSATASNDPYPCSKYQSEKFATDYVADLPEADKFRLVCINPGAIYGPPLTEAHLGGSSSVVHDLMTGKLPMCPKLYFPAIDCRDAARAHVLAMKNEEATGRFICVENTYAMKEISARCKKMYPQYSFPKRELPNMLMYMTSLFDSRVSWSFCARYLSRKPLFDSSRIKAVLKLELTDFDTTLRDTCQVMIDKSFVPDKR